MPRPTILNRTPKPIIPERMAAPDHMVDGKELRDALTAIALGREDVRASALALFKKTRDDALDFARRKFEAGHFNGHEMARVIAAIHDDLITALYDFTTVHVLRAPNPTELERLTLCAVGGYGRGEMAPGSDVDLLFLLTDQKGSAHTESVTEYILYMLWDMGLKVGHATRTIDQNIKLAKTDQTILTSLLDVRFLCGDEDMASQLFARFRKDITSGRAGLYYAN